MIQFKSVEFESVEFESVEFESVEFKSVEFKSVQFKSVQFKSVQFKSVEFKSVQSIGGILEQQTRAAKLPSHPDHPPTPLIRAVACGVDHGVVSPPDHPPNPLTRGGSEQKSPLSGGFRGIFLSWT
jgi:hypothetical protein